MIEMTQTECYKWVMNAPFKPETDVIIQNVLADACVSISNLKKNPAAVVAEAQERQVAILNRNRPVAYVIAPQVWAYLCELVEDTKLADIARQELATPDEEVEVDIDDLL